MSVFEAAAQAWRTGRPAAMATVIGANGSTPRTSGARMLVFANGDIAGTVGGGAVERRVIEIAREVIVNGRARRYHAALDTDLGMSCGGDMELWIEPLAVRTPFVIFGAGHVAAATAPLLRTLDFDVTIVDDRPDLAVPTRFEGCRVEVVDPLAFAAAYTRTDNPHFLLMTHLHERDRDLLHVLLQKPAGFVGMLGSQRKVSSIFSHLRNEGLEDDLLCTVRCPVGLDLGAETPAEIAVAIAAELVAHRRGTEAPPAPLSAQRWQNPLRAASLANDGTDAC